MSWELWTAFVITTVALLMLPGPTVMLVVSYALARGRASGLFTVPGVALGDMTAMTASLLGAGALLAASASLFMVLKYAGAAYLIWLGIKLWRAEPALDEVVVGRGETSRRAMFWKAYVVTALNPKSIVFFVAFLPQFVDPDRSGLTQFAVLEATFVSLAAINVALWAVLAGQLRARFQRPATLRLINRTGASFLIGAGVLAGLVRRGAALP